MTLFFTTPTFPHQSPGLSATLVRGLVAGLAMLAGGSTFAQESQFLYIREYRIEGSKRLKSVEVEEAVYPFLGPERTPADVEQARAALEKIYHDKGFQTVSVQIPQQDPRHGIIRMQVVEGKVGRLRVNGAKYFLPSRVKAEAKTLAEGETPNLNNVTKDIVALNKNTDRRVTPVLRPGALPGTVDIDLNVEDKLPLHGSLELNNRYSADTTKLRLNGALSYGNMFQLGHTLGANAQVAPERKEDSLLYSAYYLARISEGTSLMLTGSKQESDVATAGGTATIGRGEIVSLRALFDLPSTARFYQSLSLGIDWKSMDEETFVFGDTVITVDDTGIEYYPLSANYGATWMGKNSFTEANASLNLHLRGMGSNETEYNNKRFKSRGSFIYLRGDVAHTHDLPKGDQLFGKIQGQLSGQPLINNEQYSGGGLGTVRGYLEATSLGDNGVFGTFEYRTPSLLGVDTGERAKANEWRFHAFLEGGGLWIYDSLPAQENSFGFASAGVGTRFRTFKHLNGSVDVAFPFFDQGTTQAGEIGVTFRGWADF